MHEYQTCIYTQDNITKSVTLSVVECGYSEKNSTDNAFNTFECLALNPKEILFSETKEI